MIEKIDWTWDLDKILWEWYEDIDIIEWFTITKTNDLLYSNWTDNNKSLDNITFNISDNFIDFYIDDLKVWIIEFWLEEKDNWFSVFDFIWTKNAKDRDFTFKNKWLEWKFNNLLWNIDEDFYISWLWYFMFKEYINYMKKTWLFKVKIMIWNDSIMKILLKLEKNKLINNIKTDTDKITSFSIL